MRRVHPRAAPRTTTLKRLARDLPDDGSPLVDRLAAMHLPRSSSSRGRTYSTPRAVISTCSSIARRRSPTCCTPLFPGCRPRCRFFGSRGQRSSGRSRARRGDVAGRGRGVRDRPRRSRRRHHRVVQESHPHAARSLGEVRRLRRQHVHARDRRGHRTAHQLTRSTPISSRRSRLRCATATTCSPVIGLRSSVRTARSG